MIILYILYRNQSYNNESGHNKDKPYAVHYTRGGPWFSEWQDVEFAKEWLAERDEYLSNKFKS